MKNSIITALIIIVGFAAMSLPQTAMAWPKGGKKGGSSCQCGKAAKEPKAPREHKARHRKSADGDAQPID